MLPHGIQVCECHVENIALNAISYCNPNEKNQEEGKHEICNFCASQNTA